jgi:hypothetical protein
MREREKERKNKQTSKQERERERIASKTSQFPEISRSNFRDQISRPEIRDVN